VPVVAPRHVDHETCAAVSSQHVSICSVCG
jgi:hypothetical protein